MPNRNLSPSSTLNKPSTTPTGKITNIIIIYNYTVFIEQFPGITAEKKDLPKQDSLFKNKQ